MTASLVWPRLGCEITAAARTARKIGNRDDCENDRIDGPGGAARPDFGHPGGGLADRLLEALPLDRLREPGNGDEHAVLPRPRTTRPLDAERGRDRDDHAADPAPGADRNPPVAERDPGRRRRGVL